MYELAHQLIHLALATTLSHVSKSGTDSFVCLAAQSITQKRLRFYAVWWLTEFKVAMSRKTGCKIDLNVVPYYKYVQDCRVFVMQEFGSSRRKESQAQTHKHRNQFTQEERGTSTNSHKPQCSSLTAATLITFLHIQ